MAGAWYWVCGVPLLGPVTVGRFDVVPVALSVAALCVTGRGGVRGALTGAGAAVKVWPVTLCGRGSGRVCRGLRHQRQRNGELPRAPERPRRRDRIGRRDTVHDLAARNVLLAVAAALSCWRILRMT